MRQPASEARPVGTRPAPRRKWSGAGFLLLVLHVLLVAGAVGPPVADAINVDHRETRAVEKGASLTVEHFTGTLLIQGWDRDEIEIEARLGEHERVIVRDQGRRVLVALDGPRPLQSYADLELRVPRWMELKVEGHHLDVEITGVTAEVEVEVVGGDVFVQGARGRVGLRSVHGALTLRDCEAALDLVTTNEDIEVRDSTGRIRAASVNGDIRMEAIRSEEVEIETTNGDVIFDGAFQADGDYVLLTHNGDVTVSVAPDADLTVTVETFNGSVDSALTLELQRDRGGRRYRGVLGEGSGRLSIESFGGDVTLYDPKRGRGKRG